MSATISRNRSFLIVSKSFANPSQLLVRGKRAKIQDVYGTIASPVKKLSPLGIPTKIRGIILSRQCDQIILSPRTFAQSGHTECWLWTNWSERSSMATQYLICFQVFKSNNYLYSANK